MGKRLALTAYFFFGVVLISGCSGLPFDFGEFLDNETTEEKDVANENRGTEASETGVESAVFKTTETDVGNLSVGNAESIDSCENRNHFHLVESEVILPNFYIPECAILQMYTYTSEENRLELILLTEEGNWEKLYEAYLEFFGDTVFTTESQPDFSGAEIVAHPFGDEVYPTQMLIFEDEQKIIISMTQQVPE